MTLIIYSYVSMYVYCVEVFEFRGASTHRCEAECMMFWCSRMFVNAWFVPLCADNICLLRYITYIFTRSCSCIFSTLYIKGIFICSEYFKNIFTSKCSQLISTTSKMIISEWLGNTGTYTYFFRIILWLSFCSQDWMKLIIFMFYKSII